jgi:hypothetical protein
VTHPEEIHPPTRHVERPHFLAVRHHGHASNALLSEHCPCYCRCQQNTSLFITSVLPNEAKPHHDAKCQRQNSTQWFMVVHHFDFVQKGVGGYFLIAEWDIRCERFPGSRTEGAPRHRRHGLKAIVWDGVACRVKFHHPPRRAVRRLPYCRQAGGTRWHGQRQGDERSR